MNVIDILLEYGITEESWNKYKDILPVIPVNDRKRTPYPWIFRTKYEAILARQEGYYAWSIIDLDNHKMLEESTYILVNSLVKEPQLDNVIYIDLPYGNTYNEYAKIGGSMEDLVKILNKLPKPVTKLEQVITLLSDISNPNLIGKEVISTALINGISRSPVYIPKNIEYECTAIEKCSGCPCINNRVQKFVVDINDINILDWLYYKDPVYGVIDKIGASKKCGIITNVIEWQGLISISMIPSLDIAESKNDYVNRKGYFCGHTLAPNMNYKIKAVPVVHPKTKENVLIVKEIRGHHDAIDGFKLSENDINTLKTALHREGPVRTLKLIADYLAKNVTKIYGRESIHIGIDLAFHCPSQIYFNNDTIQKASMDCILFGDTRCGKGYIAERTARYYDVGAVVSGENASFMGLVGGAQKLENNFELYWGRFPTNNRRLVIVDEFSGFEQFGKLSRIRSEGTAEIDKGGITAQTEANTRIIWISNPKHGREMSYFNTGVETLMDLIGAAEDVARFDLAMAVTKGEVDYHTINVTDITPAKVKFDRDLLRKLVLWTWSRKINQIEFTDKAVKYILQSANMLAEEYSPTIPLIQGENSRIKLAKIAAAVAGRLFSTKDGINLIVGEEHAKIAVKLLRYFYNSPAMGYNTYSEIEANSRSLEDIETLETLFSNPGITDMTRKILIDGMLSVPQFGVKDMQDWIGAGYEIAKRYIGILVRCHAIRKSYSAGDVYRKIPAFSTWLKGKRRV